MKKEQKKADFTQNVMSQLVVFGAEEGKQITMRDIEELFGSLEFELTRVQLNELFMLMEAGRKFHRKIFEKWVYKNADFVGKKMDIKINKSAIQI